MRGRPLLLALALASCAQLAPSSGEPALSPLPPGRGGAAAAAPRVSGAVGAPEALPPAQASYGAPPAGGAAAPLTVVTGGGDISFDFADTDIREVVAQILGGILRENYTIDPAVHGTATLHTVRPLRRDQLLPTLQALLIQDGATLVRADGLYRVVPSGAGSGPDLAGGDSLAGATIVPLRYASAADLAKVLQPFIKTGGKIIADPGRNAMVISGEPQLREALVQLVKAFDVDILAGQSYSLLPVEAGDAKDFATALQEAFRGQNGGALSGLVRVVPMERVQAVLLVASESRYIDDARRVFALVQRQRDSRVRSWHVHYLQNGRADDVAYVMQQAFTPDHVTAQPSNTAPGGAGPGISGQQYVGGTGAQGVGGGIGAGGINGGIGGGGIGGGGIGGGGINGGIGGGIGGGGIGGGISGGGPFGQPGGAIGVAAGGQGGLAAGNPLLGGLSSPSGEQAGKNEMRIIPDPQNNSVLTYATAREQDTLDAMLRKIDILPLQVRIDATIAEVTLNHALQYGTQFFFRSGGINGLLSNFATPTNVTTSLQGVPFQSTFPGFVLGGNGQGGAPLALSALQAVTTVRVLSSPELLVLDNHPALLQVGDLVPYLSQSSQSTLSSNAPIVNSVNYEQTGVVMQVIPRVNSGGLVTLDIAQQVSDVDTSAPQTPGLNSPTFLQRQITSRVVIQDGQTVGLAGLIRDSDSRNNQGIPFLKNVPLIGLLAGTQNNNRTRTELLVLITPHVIYDERDADALTQDLREQLINAAVTPSLLRRNNVGGSSDPNAPLRRDLGLTP